MRISSLIILFILLQIELFSQNILTLTKEGALPNNLEKYFYIYEDTFKNKQFAEISSASFNGKFKQFSLVNENRKPNSIYWGKITIHNQGAGFINYFLSANKNNFVTIYEKDNKGNYNEKYGGELQKGSLKDVKGTRKECLFDISFLPNQEKTFFVKIESVTGFKPNLSLQLVTPKTWENQNKLTLIKQSFFQGVLWIMLTLSFLIFLGNRDKTYLYYGLYVLCISIYFLWNAGFLANYIFPELPLFNLYMWTMFPLSPFLYFLFFRKFLETKLYVQKWDTIIKWVGFLSAFSFVVAIVLQTIFLHTFYLIIISNSILLCQLVFGFSILLVIPKNNPLYPFALFGNIILALSAIYSIVVYFFGYTNFAAYGQVGSLLELVIFAMGLGYKVKLNEEKKRQAQTQLIFQLEENKKLQENINKELEEQVALRTIEITEQNEELEAQNGKIALQRDDILSKSRKLEQVNAEIQIMNQHLEELVEIRTKELIYAKNELDLFLYRTSHDLKGPLARMEGLLQLAKLQTSDANRNFLNRFDDVINEMGKTLEKLLALSIVNQSPGENEEILVNHLVANVDHIFDKKADCIQYNFNEGLSFNSKSSLIELILKALIENALAFQHKQPRVTISFYFKNEKEFIIEVADNGDGIDEKDLPKIFDMFFVGSSKSEGNGLGLFVAKKAVEALNGVISVKSEVEEGTTFIIKILQEAEESNQPVLNEKLDLVKED